jgi:[protein-PII] uridylyltransferase
VSTSPDESEDVRAFAASLPESYRRNFDLVAIGAHTKIARERESAPANVGSFFSSRVPGSAVCVVADDRPGLLATISAALVLCGLDVIEAEAYTRRVADRTNEAVDVFWVRHEKEAQRKLRVSKEEIDLLRATLIGLLEGKLDRRRADPSVRPPPTPSASETVVRFIEGQDGVFSTLEVETGDRSGLLLALAQALFQQRVQIIGSQVKTTGTRVFDRFHIVEFDGSPISSSRRLDIQVAVISAVDPVGDAMPASAQP